MKRWLILIVLAAALVALPCAAQANLVTNGGFETGPAVPDDPAGVPNNSGFVYLPAGNTTLSGWTIGGGGIDYIGNYWNASAGVRSLDMNPSYPNGPGSVEQAITTVPDQWYRVDFDLAGNPVYGGLKVLVGDPGSVQFEFNTDEEGTSRTDMGWVARSFMFQAEGESTTIKFASVWPELGDSDVNCGPALDNVRVVPVPEPATMLLVGSGLLGLAGLRRRRKG